MGRRAVCCGAVALGAPGAVRAQSARAAEDMLAGIRRSGVLRVGTDPRMPPFDFLRDGAPAGLNYELFEEVGREMRLRLAFVPSAEGVLAGLDAGLCDIASGPVAITRAAAERYRFSVPVADASAALVKRAGDGAVNRVADISGRPVGAVRGSPALAQLQKFAATLPAIPTIRQYADLTEAGVDLEFGRVVAVAGSLPDLASEVARRKDRLALLGAPIGDRLYLGYAGRRDGGSRTLMDGLDAALLRIKAGGGLARMQLRWCGISFATPDVAVSPAS